jgi:hypothetical protein
MGLLILSLILSIIISGIFWLIFGDLLPIGTNTRWDSRKNMSCYTAISFAFIFLLVFFLS